MCYYNNQYIDSSNCEGGNNFCRRILTGFDNTIIGPTGPTGPTGPCCNSENIASILNLNNPEVLNSRQMVTLSPDFIIGNSINLINNSNYINLLKGTYYISYSANILPFLSPTTISLAFIINNDTIESSIISQPVNNTNTITLSKSFLLNIVDDVNDIALINNSDNQITLSNLTISIIKVG